MLVQACLNGARPSGYHAGLPLTPVALADDAAAVVRAGAAELHLHVRGPEGAESLAPDAVDATLDAVRAAVPGTLVGISTGAWIEGDPDRTLAAIAAWRHLPDHASVNLGEPAAPAVLQLLHRRGVGIEAGLAGPEDAERLLSLAPHPLALRILIEIEEQDLPTALARSDATLAILRAAQQPKPILLHGFDATMWAFVEQAARAGFSTRVGLEDGMTLPDISPAESNAALVAAAVQIMQGVTRAPGDGLLGEKLPDEIEALLS
jgi:uncharacterized protein (DUF849 family)